MQTLHKPAPEPPSFMVRGKQKAKESGKRLNRRLRKIWVLWLFSRAPPLRARLSCRQRPDADKYRPGAESGSPCPPDRGARYGPRAPPGSLSPWPLPSPRSRSAQPQCCPLHPPRRPGRAGAVTISAKLSSDGHNSSNSGQRGQPKSRLLSVGLKFRVADENEAAGAADATRGAKGRQRASTRSKVRVTRRSL
jgi:hypothetical protein